MTLRHATIIGCLALVLAFVLPATARATLTCTNKPEGVTDEDIAENWIRLQVPIPNVAVTCIDDNGTPAYASDDVQKGYIKDIGAYIGGFYKYFVGVVGMIAVVMVFYGGLRWLTAGGNASHVKDAKEVIFAALIAIVIAFGSYTLLYTINPKLVVINPPVLKVADTFLVSTDNTCPTTKVCLSGTNVGKTCTTDAGCPNAGSGACGLPIAPIGDPAGTVSEATCGTRYAYKTIVGVQAPSETCIGTFCAPDSQGNVLACRKASDPGKTPVEGDAKCLAAAASCDRTTDVNACASLDQPGAGICRGYTYQYDASTTKQKCGWFPRLVCPSYSEEVGCGECNSRLTQTDTKASCVVTALSTPKYQGGAYLQSNELFPEICCRSIVDSNYFYLSSIPDYR